MISNKYINSIIATITAIAVIFTTLIYVNSKNITNKDSSSSTNFPYIDTVFNKEKVTEIDLEINEDTWNSLLENAINEEYVNANITVNGTKYNNVGIRAKGNSSLSMVASDDTTDRYSFKVKFDEYVKGQNLDGLSKIALNNIMSDATYMKEYLSYDLLDKMGVPTPAFAFTNIKVNGKEWGLYFAVETIEEEFIERNYGSLSGNLYKPEGNEIGGKDKNFEGMMPDIKDIQNRGNMAPPDMDDSQGGNNMAPPNMDNSQAGEDNTTQNNENLKDKSFRGGMMGGGMGASNGGNLVYTDDNKESYSDIFDNKVFKTTTESDEEKVIEMIKTLSEGTNLEKYLNVDEILRYFAVNTFLVNLDSYASNMKHNYYLYEKDGVFEILPWDYNLSFGAFNIGNASNAINFPIDNPVTDSLENSPLIGKLLEIDEYKEIYHKYLQDIVDYVNDGTYANIINQINSLISNYVKNDPTAFYTYEEYMSSIPNLINFGIDRAKSISAQLYGSEPSTTYGDIETTVNLSALGSQGGMNDKDKNMGIQRPPNDDNQENTITKPNIDDNIDSTTSSSQNNQIQQNNKDESAASNELSKNENNFNQSNTNTQDQTVNNRQERPDNMNDSSNKQSNIKGKILEFCSYLGFLLISTLFVTLYRRRKFKSIK